MAELMHMSLDICLQTDAEWCAGLQPGSVGGLSPEDDPDTIHIFSVASGHMYERLQKIMILSVIRNTRWVGRILGC